MANAILGSVSTSSCACTFVQKRPTTVTSSDLGLPVRAKKGKLTCTMKNDADTKENSNSLNTGIGSSMLAAAYAATMGSPAVALVDERMSTEGTGLPFGLSNNLLGWILLGMFGLIWTFYIVYTSSLDEDDDSGLSL